VPMSSISRRGAWIRRAVLVILLASGLSPVANARGQQEAVQVYQQGMELYRKGSYRQAIELFKRSHALGPHRNNLYYVAESYRRLGNLRRSHEHYGRYAEMLPPGRRQAFQNKLEKLRVGSPCLLSIASQPGGAVVRVDGVNRGMTPLEGSPLQIRVPGGSHEVSLSLADHEPTSRRIEAEFGEAQALGFALRPIPGPAPASQPQAEQLASRTARAPEPHTRAVEQARLARSTPAIEPPAVVQHATTPAPAPAPASGMFVDLLAGPVIQDYGDDRLETSVGVELGLRAGYLWRWRRLGLHLGLAVLCAPVDDKLEAEETASLFLSLLGGAGLRLYVHESIWAGLSLSLGPSLLLGASKSSVLFQDPGRPNPVAEVSGVFAMLALRPELALGWRVHRGLTLLLSPLAVDWSPRIEELGPGITRVLRYQVSLGVGWQW